MSKARRFRSLMTKPDSGYRTRSEPQIPARTCASPRKGPALQSKCRDLKIKVCAPKKGRWCGREDSNFHALRHSDLNAARLPIPPRPHIMVGPGEPGRCLL